jgi:hypothetical protein
MAMLAKQPKKGMAFGQTADISEDGYFETMIRQLGKWCAPTRIGTVEAVRDNVRRLADHCKLEDVERNALFEELRKWVKRDRRAKSEIA